MNTVTFKIVQTVQYQTLKRKKSPSKDWFHKRETASIKSPPSISLFHNCLLFFRPPRHSAHLSQSLFSLHLLLRSLIPPSFHLCYPFWQQLNLCKSVDGGGGGVWDQWLLRTTLSVWTMTTVPNWIIMNPVNTRHHTHISSHTALYFKVKSTASIRSRTNYSC